MIFFVPSKEPNLITSYSFLSLKNLIILLAESLCLTMPAQNDIFVASMDI